MPPFMSFYSSLAHGIAKASWAAGRHVTQRAAEAQLAWTNRQPSSQ